MKLLLVNSIDPWTRSVATVHHYVETGRTLGHEVLVYDEPKPELPRITFTADVDGVDLALFIVQVTWDVPEMPHLARLLDGVPRERRVVADLWGRLNDTVRVDHDFNHLEKLDGHPGTEWVEAIQALSGTVLQPTLTPLRNDVGSFLFHGYDEASVARLTARPRRPPPRGRRPAPPRNLTGWRTSGATGSDGTRSAGSSSSMLRYAPRWGPRAWPAGTGAHVPIGPCRTEFSASIPMLRC